MYYGVDFIFHYEGLKASGNDVSVFKEVYRMANTGVAPLCYIMLIYIIACNPKIANMPFRVQCLYIGIFFIVPKLIDHALTAIKVYTADSHMYDAYMESDVQYWMLMLFLIATPLRINHLKRLGKYNGN